MAELQVATMVAIAISWLCNSMVAPDGMFNQITKSEQRSPPNRSRSSTHYMNKLLAVDVFRYNFCPCIPTLKQYFKLPGAASFVCHQ